jgi:seryl-tRNA synthetase
MPKDLDDIYKKIDQFHKESSKKDNEISKDLNLIEKNNEKLLKEFAEVKKQVKDIEFKVDLMLEILNNFTIMLAEEEEDVEDGYDSDESWVPKEEEFWEKDNEEESF